MASSLSLGAAVIYGATALACLAAAHIARKASYQGAIRRGWALCAGGYLALLVVRLIDGEDRIRDALRAWAYAADIYQGREGLQTVFVLLFVVTAVLALAMVWRLWRRKRHSPDQALPCLANCALLGFAPLYALRIVSLHVTDMLLYTGPIRLNWVIDLSLTGISLACALLFLRLGGARR